MGRVRQILAERRARTFHVVGTGKAALAGDFTRGMSALTHAGEEMPLHPCMVAQMMSPWRSDCCRKDIYGTYAGIC